MSEAPEDGDFLDLDGVKIIYDLIVARREKNPIEPMFNTLAAVLLRVGELYTPVECAEQEWQGLMQDIKLGSIGDPRCPNGHRLNTKGAPLKLAWVPADYEWVPDSEEAQSGSGN